MEYTLPSKKKAKKVKKEKIEYDIKKLEKDILIELNNIMNHKSIPEDVINSIMYKVLLFHITDYRLNEMIIRRECLEYYQKNKLDLINKIP